MTLGKLMLAWTCLGAAFGLLLFGAVYLLRDAFAAGADLAVVTMAATAAALALQRQFIPEYFPATSPPTILAVAAALVTAGIFEWMDS